MTHRQLTNQLRSASRALLFMAASTTALTWQAIRVEISHEGLGVWGEWLAFIAACAIGVGFHGFWSSIFSTVPNAMSQNRSRFAPVILLGVALILATSSVSNVSTLFAAQARHHEYETQTRKLKKLTENVESAVAKTMVLEPLLNQVSSALRRTSELEFRTGFVSSVPGPGGVTILLNEYANQADYSAKLLPAIELESENLVNQISSKADEVVSVIKQTGLSAADREVAIRKAMDELRSLLIQLRDRLPIDALRGFVGTLLGQPVMPALSDSFSVAEKQRTAIEQKLPAIYTQIGTPLDKALVVIESLLAEVALEPYESFSNFELVIRHWHKSPHIIGLAIGIDLLPLAILTVLCAGYVPSANDVGVVSNDDSDKKSFRCESCKSTGHCVVSSESGKEYGHEVDDVTDTFLGDRHENSNYSINGC